MFAADFAVAKRLAWTPGGFALSFGRMLQDGIVKKYLDAHCPAPDLKKLCAHKDELPNDADVWFWGSPVFDSLGRFAGLDQEMEKVAVRYLTEYPALQIETAAIATARQLIDVHTGEGVLNTIWHTYCIIERYTPQLAPAMHAARQQTRRVIVSPPSTPCNTRSRCWRWRCCRCSCCSPGAAHCPPPSANWPPP